MFQNLFEQQQAITAVLLECKSSSDRNFIPTGSEKELLKPLAQATTKLCEEKSPSLSLV